MESAEMTIAEKAKKAKFGIFKLAVILLRIAIRG